MKTKLMTLGSMALFYLFIIISVIMINARLAKMADFQNSQMTNSKIINVAYNR